MSSLTGRKVGDYWLTEPLASGSLGVVYRATHEPTGRAVAVKVIPPEWGADRDSFLRLHKEASVLSSLQHPNVAELIEVRSDPAVGIYIVTELLPGRSLRDLVDQEGPLSPDRASAVGQQICAALGHAHEAGVVHRDLKPDSIVVAENGFTMLMDFGLARAVDSARLTPKGMIPGTPAYMSPEQSVGEEASPASDLYAVGAVLYEALTGRVPFEGPPMEVMARRLSEDPPLLHKVNPGVPIFLDSVVMQALNRDPAQRYPSAAALAAALQDAQPVGLPEPPQELLDARSLHPAPPAAPEPEPEPPVPPVEPQVDVYAPTEAHPALTAERLQQVQATVAPGVPAVRPVRDHTTRANVIVTRPTDRPGRPWAVPTLVAALVVALAAGWALGRERVPSWYRDGVGLVPAPVGKRLGTAVTLHGAEVLVLNSREAAEAAAKLLRQELGSDAEVELGQQGDRWQLRMGEPLASIDPEIAAELGVGEEELGRYWQALLQDHLALRRGREPRQVARYEKEHPVRAEGELPVGRLLTTVHQRCRHQVREGPPGTEVIVAALESLEEEPRRLVREAARAVPRALPGQGAEGG